MKFDGKYYTEKTSRRIQCKMTYNMQDNVRVIAIPDGTQFRLDGQCSQTAVMLGMYAAVSEDLADTKDRLTPTHSILGNIRKIRTIHTGASTKVVRENIQLPNTVTELQCHTREIERGFNTFVSKSKKRSQKKETYRMKISKRQPGSLNKKAQLQIGCWEQQHKDQTKKRNTKNPLPEKRTVHETTALYKIPPKHEMADQCICHMCNTKPGAYLE